MRRNGALAFAVTAALAAILIPQASADEGTSTAAASGSTSVQSAAGVYRLGIVEPHTGDAASPGDSGQAASSEKGNGQGRSDQSNGGQGKSGDGSSEDRKDNGGDGSKDGKSSGKSTKDSSNGSDGREELAAPLETQKRTSSFGPRISPITGAPSEFHTGQDYAGTCGTPVKSSADGKITEAGWHPYGGGMRITVSHGDGLKTTYNHMSSIRVNPGDTVDAGDRIGRVGSTGASTGCHLHFEVVVDGDTKDPLNWL